MLDFSDIDLEGIRSSIIADGYSIAPKLIRVEDVQVLREFWLKAFETRSSRMPIIWRPALGEENKIHFHETAEDCLFRSYDYLWNAPIHQRTRDLGVALNRLRNRIVEVDEQTGELFSADGYGIYLTVSYYPPVDGRMCTHQDKSDERRHWHFILPLTFVGDHFAGGGSFIEDRHGNRIGTDQIVEPGDVLFFDGSLTHGVDQIKSSPEHSLGRMQMFSIPTFLDTPINNERIAESTSIKSFLKAKIRPLKHRLTGIRGPVTNQKYFK